MNHDVVIRTEKLSLGYDGNVVVSDQSLAIARGKFTVIIGPNGCGKSTLLRSLIRGQRRLAGDIYIEDRAIERYSAKDLARQLSMLSQALPIPEGITVRQLVGYGRSPYNGLWGRLRGGDAAVVGNVMDRLDITDLAETDVASLSGGQRQRAWIAMVLAQETPIVLLDEPTTFLDISHQIELLDIAQGLVATGKTVVAVLHDINLALRYADELLVLQQGKLVANGKPSDITKPSLFADVFNIAVEVFQDPVSSTPMVILGRKGDTEQRLSTATLKPFE